MLKVRNINHFTLQKPLYGIILWWLGQGRLADLEKKYGYKQIYFIGIDIQVVFITLTSSQWFSWMKYTSRSLRELNKFTEIYTGSKVKERGVKKKESWYAFYSNSRWFMIEGLYSKIFLKFKMARLTLRLQMAKE